MKAKLLIRISALCVVVHLLGHLMGHLSWKESGGDPVKAEVIRQMTGPQFEFMGASRSLGEYYDGYSILLLVVFSMFSALLWIIARNENKAPGFSRSLLFVLGSGLLAFAVIEFVFFFPFAASISFLAGILALAGSAKISD